jgi:hypothetical protein
MFSLVLHGVEMVESLTQSDGLLPNAKVHVGEVAMSG